MFVIGDLTSESGISVVLASLVLPQKGFHICGSLGISRAHFVRFTKTFGFSWAFLSKKETPFLSIFCSLPDKLHKRKTPLTWSFLLCGSAGDRTRDLRLKRPLLYQLSYRPVFYNGSPLFLFIIEIFGPFHPFILTACSAASVWASCLLVPSPVAINSFSK